MVEDMRRLKAHHAVIMCCTIIAVLAGAPAVARSEAVAMVTDLTGNVTAQNNSEPLSILAEIEAGARVHVAAGARLVTLYVKTGDEYTFSGPADVEFRGSDPLMLKGGAIEKRSSVLGKPVVIKPVGVAEAAYVMRGGGAKGRVQLLNLHSTKTLHTWPEFRWGGIRGVAAYHFELSDSSGRTLVAQNVDKTTYRIPADRRLSRGETYLWEVATQSADGYRYVGTGDFTVDSDELGSQAEALRPDPGAPVSMRVAFAAWLEGVDLKDEARTYWKALAAERPGDGKLKSLAAE